MAQRVWPIPIVPFKFSIPFISFISMFNSDLKKCISLNLKLITLFEYLSNGGIADINGTLNFIINSNVYNPNVRKLIGPLKKLSKHTLNYVNYEDEMNNLHIIKEHELTSDEKQKIFNYMDNNNYPHWLVLFNQIAKSYIENTIEL